MNALDLKNDLIKKINDTNSVLILNRIKNILESDNKLNIIPEIKEDIKASQKDVENGNYIKNEQLDKEVLAWLDEK